MGATDPAAAGLGPVEPGHGPRRLVGRYGDGEALRAGAAPRVAGGDRDRRPAGGPGHQAQGVGPDRGGGHLLVGRAGLPGQVVAVRVVTRQRQRQGVSGGQGAVRHRRRDRGAVGRPREGQGQAPGIAQAGDQVAHIGAVEVGALDLAGGGVGPVDLAGLRVQGQGPGQAQAGDQILHIGAVEVGALDLVGAGVGPVDLAGAQGQAPRRVQAGDQVLHLGAVEAGPLDLAGAPVAPVEPPGVGVQGQAHGGLQAVGHQVLHTRAVEVGPLDLVGAGVGPVEPPGVGVHHQAAGMAQEGDQVLFAAAVEVGPLDSGGAAVGPVEPAGGQVHGQTPQLAGAGDHLFHLGAVQKSPLDLVAAGVRPVQPRGARLRSLLFAGSTLALHPRLGQGPRKQTQEGDDQRPQGGGTAVTRMASRGEPHRSCRKPEAGHFERLRKDCAIFEERELTDCR